MTTMETATNVPVTPDDSGAVTSAQIDACQQAFSTSDVAHNALNAVTGTSIDAVALNRAVVHATDNASFSTFLDRWSVTHQKQSGRCWMFAALNLFRVGAMKQMNVESFEFSQNYTLFWDKFEKSNYFLEAMIQLADRPIDDRLVAHLLSKPLEDGGQWNMFINLIQKHGVVPKAAMPETQSSSCTRYMNRNIISKLREGALALRDLRNQGAPMDAAQARKQELLQTIYRMLCIHLGTPPSSFDWQYNDKDKEFKRDGTMTPQQFADKYITVPLDDYICIVNDPRNPYGRTYTVEYLGNVVGGAPVKYLNVENEEMKDIAKRTLEGGEPVWFGCDVGPMMERKLGLWDANLFEFDRVYETEFGMDKRDRLNSGESLMTHAMLFTGVDVANGHPRRWRVENSWGEDSGAKGFYTMNDNWFDQYMFEIAARRSMLSDAHQKALEEAPTVLPAWDPMGALA